MFNKKYRKLLSTKKVIIIQVLAFCMFTALSACSGTATTDSSNSVSGNEESAAEITPASSSDTQSTEDTSISEPTKDIQEESNLSSVPARDLPESDYADIGNGTFYIHSASGSTENGEDVIVYADMFSTPIASIDYDLWDMNGSILTYIYLDGVEMDKHQVGEGYQASLWLEEEWQITEGQHKVEAVQYEDNDSSKEMVFYRSAVFTIINMDAAFSSDSGAESVLPAGDYSDIGNGTFYISNASGSTENGDDIIVYPDMNSFPFAYIDYELWDLDGSLITYIYLDGIEADKQQVGTGYQSSLLLTEKSQITDGKHKVAAVQYKENDPSGEIVFFRSADFTVKKN
jgi:hypothetical protein